MLEAECYAGIESVAPLVAEHRPDLLVSQKRILSSDLEAVADPGL